MATYIKPGVYIQEYDMLLEKTIDFQQIAIKQFSDWIAEEIDKAILDELFAEIEIERELLRIGAMINMLPRHLTMGVLLALKLHFLVVR